jgi:hypothetical protein
MKLQPAGFVGNVLCAAVAAPELHSRSIYHCHTYTGFRIANLQVMPAISYPSPLTGYENAAPLSDERAEDGKSFKNAQTGVLSSAYEKFPEPLDNGVRGGL